MIHTIKFNRSVTYTGLNPQGGAVEGVTFSKNAAIPAPVEEVCLDPDMLNGMQPDSTTGWYQLAPSVTMPNETLRIESGVSSCNMIGPVNTGDLFRITIDVISFTGGDGTPASVTFGGDNDIITIPDGFSGTIELDHTVVSGSTNILALESIASSTGVLIVESCSVYTMSSAGEEATLVEHSTDMSAPNDVISYDVTWDTNPIAADIVEFVYSGGEYNSIDGAVPVGIELLPDPTFDGGIVAQTIDGWTNLVGGFDIVAGQGIVIANCVGSTDTGNQEDIVPGADYVYEVDVVSITGDGFDISIGGETVATITTTGISTDTIKVNETTSSIVGLSGFGHTGTSTIEMLSIKQGSLGDLIPMGEDTLKITNCADAVLYDLAGYQKNIVDSKTAGYDLTEDATFAYFSSHNNDCSGMVRSDANFMNNPRPDLSYYSVNTGGDSSDMTGVYLIAKNIALGSTHTNDSGKTVCWQQQDGTIISGTLGSQHVIFPETSSYDIALYLVDTDISDGVTIPFAKVMPPNWVADYAPQVENGNIPDGLIVLGKRRNKTGSGTGSWWVINDLVHKFMSETPDIKINGQEPYSGYEDAYAITASGDSSSGTFLLLNGELVLLNVIKTTAGGYDLSNFIDEINAGMNVLDPAATELLVFDMSTLP